MFSFGAKVQGVRTMPGASATILLEYKCLQKTQERLHLVSK